jgi:flavin reductase (DIM6/NTAB) family NADH-FMN oxidoreductase RutF
MNICRCFLSIIGLHVVAKAAAFIHITTVPPLLDVPTYSIATLNHDGSTNMNILTYATPVGVEPHRVWALGLFKGTLSHENFLRTKKCILQLLGEEHVAVIRILGGMSGRDISKGAECSKQSFDWQQYDAAEMKLLPRCLYYIKLSCIGDILDVGNHDVALCRVEEMFIPNDIGINPNYLSTGKLRKLGIINEKGRIISPEA